jgi:hypothetical protein
MDRIVPPRARGVLRRCTFAVAVGLLAACSGRAQHQDTASTEPIPECDAYVALVRSTLAAMGERAAAAGEARVTELVESLRTQGAEDRDAARARCLASTRSLQEARP